MVWSDRLVLTNGRRPYFSGYNLALIHLNKEIKLYPGFRVVSSSPTFSISCKYLLLIEFEVRTVRYGPSFFSVD